MEASVKEPIYLTDNVWLRKHLTMPNYLILYTLNDDGFPVQEINLEVEVIYNLIPKLQDWLSNK